MRLPSDSRLAACSLVAVLGLLCGCDRPRVAIVCHNANCATPLEPARDDTLAALSESLALRHEGRTVLDGIEIDVLWSADAGACLFAHDHDQPNPESMDRVTELLGQHLASAHPRNAGPFYVKLDLKESVDRAGSAHARADIDAHVACALGVFLTLRTVAQQSGAPLEVYFDSESPELLRALAQHPDWPTLASPGVGVKLSAAFGVAGVTSAKLAEFEGSFDAVSLHPDWMSSAALHTLEARGIELTLWTRTLGARQLRAIADVEPRFVSTSDALRLRRWLGD